MSYEFIKLSEVTKVDTSYNANLLIEEDGEIKRLSTENINFGGSGQQVQADWNEKDDTSPAFIANKPTINTEVVNYYMSTGSLYRDGHIQTLQQVKDAWNSGASIRIDGWFAGGDSHGSALVVGMYFGESSGSEYGSLYYIESNGTINSHSFA